MYMNYVMRRSLFVINERGELLQCKAFVIGVITSDTLLYFIKVDIPED